MTLPELAATADTLPSEQTAALFGYLLARLVAEAVAAQTEEIWTLDEAAAFLKMAPKTLRHRWSRDYPDCLAPGTRLAFVKSKVLACVRAGGSPARGTPRDSGPCAVHRHG